MSTDIKEATRLLICAVMGVVWCYFFLVMIGTILSDADVKDIEEAWYAKGVESATVFEKRRAVDEGHAEYYLDPDGHNRYWRWKECETCRGVQDAD